MSLEDFQKLIKSAEKPVFVMYTANWCSPCKLIKPIFIEASKKTTKAIFIIVDIDEGSDIAIEYKITKIPVVKVFIKGGEVDHFSGSSGDALKKLVSKHAS